MGMVIEVYRDSRGWAWVFGTYWNGGYDTSSHALRDAWTRLGSMPALIFMGRP